MPTIDEVKSILARKKFFIQTDLTSCYFQQGVSRRDSQYLCTYHPFKGVMCYQVSVMGLRNSQEHSTNMLLNIFHDLIRQEKVLIQADAILPVADSVDELTVTYIEVLTRLRAAGLTIKPSAVVIAPTSMVLWGWKLKGSCWQPTSHVRSSLEFAEPPSTVKKLRGYLGAFKQMSQCIPQYAKLLGPLEDLHAGKSSFEKITWTENLLESFNEVKKSIKDYKAITIPRPEDKLKIYSDWCALTKSIGGRMEIHRQLPDGSTKVMHGGCFSARANSFQKKWLACDGESLAIRTTQHHFKPFIRQSLHQVEHLTDSSPCVMAWERGKRGFFSTSARISTFLSDLATENVILKHKAGKTLHASDHASRNPTTCDVGADCQICSFVREQVQVGDSTVPLVYSLNVPSFLSVTVQDIEQGKVNMPFLQSEAWRKVQMKDPAHRKLDWLISSGQQPEKKKTKGINTYIKHLYTQYKSGKLSKSGGVFKVNFSEPNSGISYKAISVPVTIFPGLIQSLHLRMNHPCKTQLNRLARRYFHCPGQENVVTEITDNCFTCATLKRLPADLVADESTQLVDVLGAEFAADIVMRYGQKILLVKEKLSSYLQAKEVPNQEMLTLRDALLELIIPLKADTGATVRTDNHPAFNSLLADSKLQNSPMTRNNVTIELGQTLNKNRNPTVENSIKELHAQILKVKPGGGKLSSLELQEIIAAMNDKSRNRGLTSKEILLRRHKLTGKEADWTDKELGEMQFDIRKSRHTSNKVKHDFNVGDNVLQLDDGDKLKAKEMFKILDIIEEDDTTWYVINKCNEQFRERSYRVKGYQIIPAPGFEEKTTRKARQLIENEIEKEASTEDDENLSGNTEHLDDVETSENDEDQDDPAPVKMNGQTSTAGTFNTPKVKQRADAQNPTLRRSSRKEKQIAIDKIKNLATNNLFQISKLKKNRKKMNIHVEDIYYEEINNLVDRIEDDLEMMLLENGDNFDDDNEDPGLLLGHLSDLQFVPELEINQIRVYAPDLPPAGQHAVEGGAHHRGQQIDINELFRNNVQHERGQLNAGVTAIADGKLGRAARPVPQCRGQASPGDSQVSNRLIADSADATNPLPLRRPYLQDDVARRLAGLGLTPPILQPDLSYWPMDSATDAEEHYMMQSSLENLLLPSRLFSSTDSVFSPPPAPISRTDPMRRSVRRPKLQRGRPSVQRSSAMALTSTRLTTVAAPQHSRLVPKHRNTRPNEFFNGNVPELLQQDPIGTPLRRLPIKPRNISSTSRPAFHSPPFLNTRSRTGSSLSKDDKLPQNENAARLSHI